MMLRTIQIPYRWDTLILHWCDWICLYWTYSSLLFWHHEGNANGYINLASSTCDFLEEFSILFEWLSNLGLPLFRDSLMQPNLEV